MHIFVPIFIHCKLAANQMKLPWTATLSIAGIFLSASIPKVSGNGESNVTVRVKSLKKRFDGIVWRNRRLFEDLEDKGTSCNTTFAVKSLQKFGNAATFRAGVYIGSNISHKVRLKFYLQQF